MAFETRIAVRFADIDWARVVYFARYFDFCHRAIEDFFNAQPGLSYAALLTERNLGFPIVNSDATFFAPLRLGDTVRIVVEFTTVTERSYTARFTLYRGESDVRCAVIQLKQAAIDALAFKGIALPKDLAALLEPHLVQPGLKSAE